MKTIEIKYNPETKKYDVIETYPDGKIIIRGGKDAETIEYTYGINPFVIAE